MRVWFCISAVQGVCCELEGCEEMCVPREGDLEGKEDYQGGG